MERRTFLVGSAMALPMMGAGSKVNVAMVGVGGRGTAHVNEYLTIPEARMAAVCDVNTAATERAEQLVYSKTGVKPKIYQDLRKLYEDKDIDAVSIATPNHWHALCSIWACQAGKDVYVEKPASYNIFEGQQMVKAARKYNRMVQVGMQSRSTGYKHRAVELVRSGAIGKVYYAKGLCYKRRASIGHADDAPVPPGLDWDKFLGPAPKRAFNPLRFRYNWHWFWDTGNGDIGNQGIHEMDVARWGLGRGLPKSVVSTGGKFLYEDDQETPNTQTATFDYGDAQLVFEVRGLSTGGGEADLQSEKGNFMGNIWMGSKGYLKLDRLGYQIFLGDKREPGPSSKDSEYADTKSHMVNFLEAVKSRDAKHLNGEIAEGVTSAVLVHMANTSYRLGRKLAFDASTEKYVNDAEANAMLTRPHYRDPYNPAKI
ncbi:MAG: Gfo/Idh/MocA family oxidoreductase [Bryobacteraceae bacterium]